METAPAKVPFSFARTEIRFRDRGEVSLSLLVHRAAGAAWNGVAGP